MTIEVEREDCWKRHPAAHELNARISASIGPAKLYSITLILDVSFSVWILLLAYLILIHVNSVEAGLPSSSALSHRHAARRALIFCRVQIA
jgi:hypothetical protein